jgi:hypothetical protein
VGDKQVATVQVEDEVFTAAAESLNFLADESRAELFELGLFDQLLPGYGNVGEAAADDVGRQLILDGFDFR